MIFQSNSYAGDPGGRSTNYAGDPKQASRKGKYRNFMTKVPWQPARSTHFPRVFRRESVLFMGMGMLAGKAPCIVQYKQKLGTRPVTYHAYLVILLVFLIRVTLS